MPTPKSTRPHGNLKDLSGSTFGRLTVIRHVKVVPGRLSKWECRCDCGAMTMVTTDNLNRGRTKSCGKHMPVKHGMHNTPEYKAWEAAKDRCFNPSCAEYVNYGGRGITMCAEWRESFTAFIEHIGPKPTGLTLDRIDNEGHYEPGNVRWATQEEQHKNRRISIHVTLEGQTHTLKEWSEIKGIPLNTLNTRYHRGKRIFQT